MSLKILLSETKFATILHKVTVASLGSTFTVFPTSTETHDLSKNMSTVAATWSNKILAGLLLDDFYKVSSPSNWEGLFY